MSLAAPPRVVSLPSLWDAMEAVATALAVTGLRVALDARDFNPPGVLVNPPTLTTRFQNGSFDAVYSVVVAAANTSRREAYRELSEMVLVVQGALPRIQVARPVDVWTADQTALIAAYELGWSDQLRAR